MNQLGVSQIAMGSGMQPSAAVGVADGPSTYINIGGAVPSATDDVIKL
jgi:hypothetical protein